MLALQNIDVTLGKNSQLSRQVLNRLNFNVAPGEFAVIVGGNGAGKSTIFNVIAGFITPDNGQVFIDCQEVTTKSQMQRAAAVAKVMQDPRIGTLENMTILENMAFAYRRGSKRSLLPFINARRRAYFSAQLAQLNMGLENRLYELVANLSGGQRQALSLIMALVADCKLLLLDEITAALDPNTAEQVMALASKIVRAEGKTCIMITHNMQHALQYADSIWLLKNGNFVNRYSAADKQKLNPVDLATEFC